MLKDVFQKKKINEVVRSEGYKVKNGAASRELT